MGRKEEALAHLRAAWVIEPGNQAVFDALSALLAPTPRDPDDAGRNVRERIELYSLAVGTSPERTRKIVLHEKLAAIWKTSSGSRRVRSSRSRRYWRSIRSEGARFWRSHETPRAPPIFPSLLMP